MCSACSGGVCVVVVCALCVCSVCSGGVCALCVCDMCAVVVYVSVWWCVRGVCLLCVCVRLRTLRVWVKLCLFFFVVVVCMCVCVCVERKKFYSIRCSYSLSSLSNP